MIVVSNSLGNAEFDKNSNLNCNFLELTNYLKIYYDFAYFLCISPFRLIFIRSSECSSSAGDGKFFVKHWWPQKIFCGALTLLGFTWLLRDIRLVLPGESSSSIRNPSIYFGVMLGVVGSFLKLAVIRVFWRKQNEICEIVNFLKSTNRSCLRHGNQEQERTILKKRNIFIFLVCCLYTSVALGNWILGRGLSVICYEGPILTEWNVKWWWSNVILAGRYNVFMDTGNNTTTMIKNGTFPLKLDTFLGVIGSLGFYYRRVLGSHCNCYLLMAILTLWSCARKFSRRLSMISDASPVIIMETAQSLPHATTIHTDNNNWNEIHHRYLAIKKLAKMINSVYSLNVTMFLVEAILYYAVSFDDIFVEHSKENDATKVIRILFYFGSTCAVLLASADVSRIMSSSFKDWLSLPENRKHIPMDQLYVVLNELDTNTVAISSSNVFPVTYSLAAKLLGVTVTYFIICVQV